MAMLPQPSVGQMDREIQTRPPAERQSQLPNYLLSRVCTTINVNSSPHSAAYVRRWIGSALLQIMVCRLFGTKPLSGETFRYSQELSPGPLVDRNKLQWNFNQNRKLFIHGIASEYIVCEIAAIFFFFFLGGGRGWANWTRIKHAAWPSKCIVNTHVWINLYQFHWNVLYKYDWRNGLVFISSHYMSQRKPIFHMLLLGHNEFKCFGVIAFMKWWQRTGKLGELVTLRKYIWKIHQLSEVGLKWLIYFAADLAVSSKKLYL